MNNHQAPPSPAPADRCNDSHLPSGGMIDNRWQRPLIVFSQNAPAGSTNLVQMATESFVVEVKAALQMINETIRALEARLQAIEEGMVKTQTP